MKLPSVLIADDHIIVSQGLQSLLEDEFDVVGTVTNGRALIEAARELKPDVLVVRDSSKVRRDGIHGAPDWVVEVLSPSTAGHDHIRKRRVYERAGVREYWLVHAIDRIVTVYRRGAQGFDAPEVMELTGTTDVRAIAGLSIAWAPVVANLSDGG